MQTSNGAMREAKTMATSGGHEIVLAIDFNVRQQQQQQLMCHILHKPATPAHCCIPQSPHSRHSRALAIGTLAGAVAKRIIASPLGGNWLLCCAACGGGGPTVGIYSSCDLTYSLSGRRRPRATVGVFAAVAVAVVGRAKPGSSSSSSSSGNRGGCASLIVC